MAGGGVVRPGWTHSLSELYTALNEMDQWWECWFQWVHSSWKLSQTQTHSDFCFKTHKILWILQFFLKIRWWRRAPLRGVDDFITCNWPLCLQGSNSILLTQANMTTLICCVSSPVSEWLVVMHVHSSCLKLGQRVFWVQFTWFSYSHVTDS